MRPRTQPAAAAAKAAVVAPQTANGGAPAEHAPIAGHAPTKTGAGSAHVAAPAPTIAGAAAGAGNDAQLDGILNTYTPKSPQTTQTLGRIKQMGDVASGFSGQLDVYVSQGGAIDNTIAGASNFLGVGKEAGAVWRNNPYRNFHGVLGGIMTGMSAVKNVCGIVGSISAYGRARANLEYDVSVVPSPDMIPIVVGDPPRLVQVPT